MRLGILGGGQLGRMLAQAARPLGVQCVVIDRNAQACAGDVAPLVVSEFDDVDTIAAALQGVDAITFEVETLPADTVQSLRERGFAVHPSPHALRVAQDRVDEKQFLRHHGVSTAPFMAVSSVADALAAVDALGLPCLMKTRRDGYDGRGQVLIERREDAATAFETLQGRPCVVEGWVAYDREVSLISVRGLDGVMCHFPLIHNEHERGVLSVSHAPAPGVSVQLQQAAQAAAERVLVALDYVGILTIEFFEVQGELLANEMAPRVHNSGHCLIEGADTSQFAQHVRAVMGLPLGSVQVRPCGMVNLLGGDGDLNALLRVPGAHVHRYNKAPRPRRKVGHVTITGRDRQQVQARVEQVKQVVT